jgi:multidrug efflux pump subunit AcrB
VALVVGVMALFLRQWSATMIVSSVLGVSLIASFALMYVLGFSLNNLTLVAIVIAVGFVVDDAIVVVENIHRHLEAGDDSRKRRSRAPARSASPWCRSASRWWRRSSRCCSWAAWSGGCSRSSP